MAESQNYGLVIARTRTKLVPGLYYRSALSSPDRGKIMAIMVDVCNPSWLEPIPFQTVIASPQYITIRCREWHCQSNKADIRDVLQKMFMMACFKTISDVSDYISQEIENLDITKIFINILERNIRADSKNIILQQKVLNDELPKIVAEIPSASENNNIWEDEIWLERNHINDDIDMNYLCQVNTSSSSSNAKFADVKTLSQPIVTFLTTNFDNFHTTNDPLPLSYGQAERIIITDSQELIKINWGLNIYDGACHEIALHLMGKANNAMQLLRIFNRTLTLETISANYTNSSRRYKYFAPIDKVKQEGDFRPIMTNMSIIPRGVTMKWITNHFAYNWSSNDNDRKLQPGKYQEDSIIWNDWRPSTGESFWMMVIAPSLCGKIVNETFIKLLPHLIDKNGGFYTGPMDSKNKNEITMLTQDNCSAYAGLNFLLHASKTNPSDIRMLTNTMSGIIDYYRTIVNRNLYYFQFGKTWYGHHWLIRQGTVKINNEFVTTNINNVRMPTSSLVYQLIYARDQIWSILAIGPEIIDNEIFNEKQACLNMWRTLCLLCGRHRDNKLIGLSANNFINEAISHETTLTAIICGKMVEAYYKGLDVNVSDVENDIANLENYVANNSEIHHQTSLFTPYLFDNDYQYPLPHLGTAAWYIFYKNNFNPLWPS